ncbi:MAG: hypothetical protein P8P70_12480 [Sulfitobacter sp.]|nr:hypothetical protein [Sulfitobacter sp.]
MKQHISRKPARRTVLKWTHALIIPLLIWFVLVTPQMVVPLGGYWFALH